VSAHCKQDTLQLHSYLEHQGKTAGRVAVRLRGHRRVVSGEPALLHNADSHPVLGEKGCGDSGHMF
jgi:hypothetical protein